MALVLPPSASPPRLGAKLEITEEELEALVQARVAAALRAPLPSALFESFTPNDPVHGLIHLPDIVRIVIDTPIFQRMRHIKQLGIIRHVFPGATHDRFNHSIGTAFLAHELIKGLRLRQPELGVTDRDALCVTLAALCHDLGHPCYSHMFEVFVRTLGCRRRRAAEAAAQTAGREGISAEEDEEFRRYEKWAHEEASTRLLEQLFEDLRGPLRDAGLTADVEGDDFACIVELIDPPKKRLDGLMERQQLHTAWAGVIKGRPVEKAWLYEIVSNWRSGIDVDKFDYFRRDAHYLGIHRQFDHERYMKLAKVVRDADGVPTISPPEKDKYSVRSNMMELRKMLHRVAYQHKTGVKLQMHMIDILEMMDEHVRVIGVNGRRLRPSEAAVELDPVAYPKLTDTFMEAKLLSGEDPLLAAVVAEYERRFFRRELMRLVGGWELPHVGENGISQVNGPLSLPSPQAVIAGVHAGYAATATCLESEVPLRPVEASELRCHAAAFHYGMGDLDPTTRIVFHSTRKNDEENSVDGGFHGDGTPLRQKIFMFWNPRHGLDDTVTLQRLSLSFMAWAQKVEEDHSGVAALSAREDSTEADTKPQVAAATRKPKRVLKMEMSCPVSMSPLKKFKTKTT